MRNRDKIVFFDIDHTIFNARLYRKNLYANLAGELGYNVNEFSKNAKQAYAKLREKTYFFTPDILLSAILSQAKIPVSSKRVQSVFWNKKLYESCVYSDVDDVFSYLSKKAIKIGIFSTGDFEHQKIKIESLNKYLAENHIYISPDKFKIIKNTFSNLKEHHIYVVDDVTEILAEVKKHDQNITTLWIKRTRTNGAESINNFVPDAIIKNLSDIIPIIETA